MARQATLSGGTGSGAGSRSRRSVPSIPEYLQECRNELRKVTWPTREETTQLTIAVVTMSVFMAVFLWAIDIGLNDLVAKITGF